jgi:hypothetical protein
MYMKKEDNDVPLHDGEMFMIKDAPYMAHFKATGHEKQPVCSSIHKVRQAHSTAEINLLQSQGREPVHRRAEGSP